VSVALSVRALGKRYGGLEALREVSFEVRAGEMVAIVGPNGAGKTTLLSIIAGVQGTSAGEVAGSGSGRGGEVGWAVGWAPQHPALYSKLSVAENMRLFARLERVADPEQSVAAMLEQTGLGARADEQVGRLSGGNRQRVNVAIGLLGDPPVLALDEPSTALDPAQRQRLWGFIRGLAQAGTSVLFSTHNVVEAARYGDRVLVLDEGRLLFDGAPAALTREAPVEEGADFEQALVAFLAARAEQAGQAAR
jgi:ABC-2 type transport system ATP-binding protein